MQVINFSNSWSCVVLFDVCLNARVLFRTKKNATPVFVDNTGAALDKINVEKQGVHYIP
jgi:hypothetical protein